MQQIIVYRNPAEAAFWNTIMSADNIFPIFVGVVVFFAVLLITDSILYKSKHRVTYTILRHSYFSPIVGAICGIFTVWYMWI